MAAPLQKHRSILELVEKLQSDVPLETLEAVDYWEADLLAIGLRNSQSSERLVYVSIFLSEPDRFHFDLELADPETESEPRVINSFESATYGELLNAVTSHLTLVE